MSLAQKPKFWSVIFSWKCGVLYVCLISIFVFGMVRTCPFWPAEIQQTVKGYLPSNEFKLKLTGAKWVKNQPLLYLNKNVLGLTNNKWPINTESQHTSWYWTTASTTILIYLYCYAVTIICGYKLLIIDCFNLPALDTEPRLLYFFLTK